MELKEGMLIKKVRGLPKEANYVLMVLTIKEREVIVRVKESSVERYNNKGTVYPKSYNSIKRDYERLANSIEKVEKKGGI